MKISSSVTRAPLPAELPSSKPGTPSVSGGTASGATAPVALSSTARALSAMADGGQDIDLARVQSIRDAIAAGQLKIDTSRIADGLIASARDLLKS